MISSNSTEFTTRDGRQFAFPIGTAFLVLSGLLFWREKELSFQIWMWRSRAATLQLACSSLPQAPEGVVALPSRSLWALASRATRSPTAESFSTRSLRGQRVYPRRFWSSSRCRAPRFELRWSSRLGP